MRAIGSEGAAALLPAAEAFGRHMSSDARKRVAQLHLYSDKELRLEPAVILALAGALPHLAKLTIHPSISSSSNLFDGLAECCPKLRELKVSLPGYSAGAVAGLSALRSLTRLELAEHTSKAEHGSIGEAGYPAALLQQLAALKHLTCLSVDFTRVPAGGQENDDHDEGGNINTFPAAVVARALVGLPALRCLKLTGTCWLSLDDFPALAAAFPALEKLHCDVLLGYSQDGPGRRKAWHMPNLTEINTQDLPDLVADDNSDPYQEYQAAELGTTMMPAEAVLALAARCPALKRLGGLAVMIDLGSNGRLRNPKAVQRLLQRVADLAQRRVVGAVILMVASAEQAEGICSLRQPLLQPGQPGSKLVCRIRTLHANKVSDDAALRRLVARLPYLEDVTCPLAAVETLAPLRMLRSVFAQLSPWLWDKVDQLEVLEAFAQRRVAEAGAAAAEPVSVCTGAISDSGLIRKYDGFVLGTDVWLK